MPYQAIGFRLTPKERGVLEELSDRLRMNRADVVRLALRDLDAKVQVRTRPAAPVTSVRP